MVLSMVFSAALYDPASVAAVSCILDAVKVIGTSPVAKVRFMDAIIAFGDATLGRKQGFVATVCRA